MTSTDHNRGHTVVLSFQSQQHPTTTTPVHETSVFGISRGGGEVTCPEKELVAGSRTLTSLRVALGEKRGIYRLPPIAGGKNLRLAC